MKKFLLPIFALIIFSFLGTNSVAQSCGTTNINGSVRTISCGQTCTNLSFQVPHLKGTGDYILSSIPYNPFPYIVATGGTEDTRLYNDDEYSALFAIPFAFCFYDSTYSSAVIGSNGLITFDASNGTGTCANAYTIGPPIPSSGGGAQCDQGTTYYPRAAIMGAYSDLDPRIVPSPTDRRIQWRVEGVAPCRRFVVSFFKIGVFGRTGVACENTFQMVMHETTGIIEFFFLEKACFSSTTNGYGIMGIQNWNRNQAVFGAGRNATQWTATNEGWRFTPSGGTSRFISSELLTLGLVPVATADTATSLAGQLDLNFTNICPTGNSQQYIVRTTFAACQGVANFVTLDTITINRLPSLPATATFTQTTCGSANGTITVNVTPGNGVPAFLYGLDGATPQASNVFTGVAAGIHSIYVVDSQGCDTTFNITVTSTASLASTLLTTATSCNTATDGSITVTATQGTGPFTYTLTGPGGPYVNSTGIFTGLGAGTYTINFVDAATCTGTRPAIVIAAGTANPTASVSATGTSCNGASNGTLTINITPAGNYTYTLNPGNIVQVNNNVFIGLSAGNTYSISYISPAGCSGIRTNLTVPSGSTLNGASTLTPTTCPGAADGTATILTTGLGPFTFTLNPGYITQPTNTFTGLAAGPYTATFTNFQGCTSNPVNFTIINGPGPTGTASTTPTSCAGANDGTITVNPTIPGVYTYTLNPGNISQATPTFTGLSSGNYIVTFGILNSCTSNNINVTVAGGTAPTGTTSQTATSCPGLNDGTITVNPSGAGPFTYILNPGNVTQATPTFTGLGAGTYTVSFITGGNCNSGNLPAVTIVNGAAPTGTTSQTPTSCPGINDGTITVTPSGTGPFTYTLNPGNITQGTPTFTGLGAGTYTVSFTTGVGCASGNLPAVTIVNGAAPTGTTSQTATSCPGINDGTITVTPSGTGPFTYTLNPGNITQGTPTFTGLAAGTYTVSFTTGVGCASGNLPAVTIVNGAAPIGTATSTATTCPTATDGTITITPTGAGPYTFTLNPGNITQVSPTFTGLAANTYTVSFTTGAGCAGVVNSNVVVAAGPNLTSTIAVTQPVCNGINGGSVTITPTSGNAPFTYILSPANIPQANQTFLGLAPGTYTYGFTDAGGCTGSGTFTLATNPPIFANGSLTMPLCNGGNNGSINFAPAGGVPGYQYLLLPGAVYQASNTFNGLTAGTYSFRIRDNVNCTKDTTITLGEPTLLTASAINNVAATCNGNDGSIQITANGGTPTYSYSIDNGVTYVASNIIVAPSVGNYPNIRVRDANGCIANASTTVALIDTMRLELGVDTTICAGGSIVLQPQTNAQTNIFNWTTIPAASINTLSNPDIKNPTASPTAPTSYVLNATWGACTRIDTVTINVLRRPVANAGADVTICPAESTTLIGTVTNTSGTVNYLWSPATYLNRADSNVVIATPPTGSSTTYTLTVTDNYGCNFSVTDAVVVTVRPRVNAFAGNDTIAATGLPHQLFGSGGSQYLWSPAAPLNNASTANPIATLNADTRFTLIVEDVIGCFGYDTVFIKVYDGPAYYVPTAFTPNGDGRNDIFRAVPSGVVSTEYFRVFDRWGKLVFETSKWLKGWDGTYQGRPQAGGAYVWIIKGRDKDGKTIERKGTVILIR